MQTDDLRAALRSAVGPSHDALLREFSEHAGTEDPEQFLQWLRDRSSISEQDFRDLHARGTLVLKSLRTLATQVFGGESAEPAEAESGDGPTRRAYVYLGRIGRGAMGEVQIARDPVLQRKVAIKRMHHDLPKRRRMEARFLSEAQITAQLDHPNIVPVYDLEIGTNGAAMAYTMKLIRGRTLQEVVDECRSDIDAGRAETTSLDERLEHFLKVCDAIAYAHSRGVVHRDLKPENIMIGPFNEVYVMDWGIARVLDSDAEGVDDLVELVSNDAHKTRTGTVIGTPAYMSPEQAEGRIDLVDGRSDQFSLGLILHEIVSLKRAIPGDKADEILSRVQEGKLEPLRTYVRRGTVPTELAAIVAKATARRPEQRYPDVAELARDIRRYRKGEAVIARADTPRQRINRWMTSHRELMLSVTLLSVLLVFASITTLGLHNQRIRNAAEHREQQLSRWLGDVGRVGHHVDSELQRYAATLDVLAAQVELELSRPPNPAVDPWAFGQAEAFRPPDLAASPRYEREISLDHAVLAAATGVDPAEHTPQASRLLAATGAMQAAVLRSASPEALGLADADQDAIIGVSGAPLAWVMVGLEDGLSASYPGHAGLPPGFDARKAPWYGLPDTSRGATWGAPMVDPAGLGLVLPASSVLRSGDGAVLGVAAVMLPFDPSLKGLLVPEFAPAGAEGFLVDEQARIVVQSSEERDLGDRRFTRALRLKSFPAPQLEQRIPTDASGYFEHEGDLYIFMRMESLGWYYVMKARADQMLR
jgi:serine/threonine-protein kinase